MKVYVARDIDGELWLYQQKPKKNKDDGEWNSFAEFVFSKIKEKNNEFKNVKWEDNKPTECELKIIK